MTESSNKTRLYILLWPTIAMIMTALILVAIMISRHIIPFGNTSLARSDCFHQLIPFINEYRRKLLNHESLFYTWNALLGSDFMTLFSNHLSSPFNLLIFFTGSNLHLFISVIMLIKIPLSAFTMGLYLYSKVNNKVNNPIICALSVSYALSSYMIGYSCYIMWLDCLIIFPIIMLGMDRFIENENPVLYIISLAFCIYSNIYFSIMICIFIVLRFFTYEFKNFRYFIIKAFHFAGASILSAGLTFIYLSILINWYLNSSIVTSEQSPSPYWYTNIFTILKNLYTFSWPIVSSNSYSDANLYAGIAPIVLIFFLPFIKKLSIKERLSRIFIFVILLISMNNSLLNYIWHGLHYQQSVPNRFSFLLIFLILETACIIFNNDEHIDTPGIIASGILAAFLPIIIYFFTDFDGYYSSKALLIVAIILSILYYILFIIGMFNNKCKYIFRIIISSVIVAEVLINAFNVYGVVYSEKPMIGIEGRYDSINYIRNINSNHTDFYREEIYDNILDNENIFQGIHSIGSFSSVQDYNATVFLGKCGLEQGYPILKYNGSTPFLDSILGVRYIHTYDPSLVKYNYELLYSSDIGDLVYENKNALPIGYGVNKESVNPILIDNINFADNQNNLAKVLTGISPLYEQTVFQLNAISNIGTLELIDNNIHLYNLPINSYEEQPFIDGELIIPNDGKYFIQFQNDSIESYILAINDEYYTSEDFKYKLIYLGDLSINDSIFFELYLNSPNSSEDISIKLYKYNEDNYINTINTLKNSTINVTNYTDNTLSGSFSLTDDQILMLTIPYSKGWKVKVDGNPVQTFKILDCFIGIDAGSGSHSIEMVYTPPGFISGIIITIISWIIFIILLYKRHKLIYD